jgi:hypothetical protein
VEGEGEANGLGTNGLEANELGTNGLEANEFGELEHLIDFPLFILIGYFIIR